MLRAASRSSVPLQQRLHLPAVPVQHREVERAEVLRKSLVGDVQVGHKHQLVFVSVDGVEAVGVVVLEVLQVLAGGVAGSRT